MVVGQTVTLPRYTTFEDFEACLKKRVADHLADSPEVFNHTLDVVTNMKRLVVREGGPMDVLVCAAYLHEIARLEPGELTITGKSLTMARAEVCGKNAADMLVELGMSPEKAARVKSLLERNECVELKRAHHRIF